jgi:hypothetical protein
MKVPEGVIGTRIDPETGMRSAEGKITEYFYAESVPAELPSATAEQGLRSPDEPRPQLF